MAMAGELNWKGVGVTMYADDVVLVADSGAQLVDVVEVDVVVVDVDEVDVVEVDVVVVDVVVVDVVEVDVVEAHVSRWMW